ncbi:nmrA-like family domain-containing protein [Trichoderma breve]|uniref:NmrA-like family domain-containing protein n=1 Tax=Trichoderma breve TaxID=2034170 RepID=A0A9W9JSN4_9HYPO|nr:nmrA-like family domain-containing protein [Trichoderma breve]KAJ4865500.1 nmrA-like family domain-containing protein [Trichoderma breve]
MTPILITGATGSTGRSTIKYLLQKGLSVRAFVHKEDDRSRQLEAQGAEVVVGNLLDLRSVRRAFEGVKRAYFCYPVQPGLIDATTIFAQAAKEAKAEYIVNMSQIVARGEVPSNASINHWLSERVFDWAGTPVTHLQPTIFHEWLIYASKAIREEDCFAVPFSSTGKFASVSTEDIGELTATLLENPAGHGGQSYPLSGPTELTPPEIADVLSKHLGRKIRFEQVKASALIRSFSPVEIPYLEQHFDAAGQMHRDGLMAGTNDLFEKIIGHPPQSTEEFVAQNKSIWSKNAEEFIAQGKSFSKNRG